MIIFQLFIVVSHNFVFGFVAQPHHQKWIQSSQSLNQAVQPLQQHEKIANQIQVSHIQRSIG